MDFYIIDLESLNGREGPSSSVRDEEDLEVISIDHAFEIGAFNGSDPTLAGIF